MQTVTPPKQFACVEPGVYRCAFPRTLAQVNYLRTLRPQTYLKLSIEALPKAVRRALEVPYSLSPFDNNFGSAEARRSVIPTAVASSPSGTSSSAILCDKCLKNEERLRKPPASEMPLALVAEPAYTCNGMCANCKNVIVTIPSNGGSAAATTPLSFVRGELHTRVVSVSDPYSLTVINTVRPLNTPHIIDLGSLAWGQGSTFSTAVVAQTLEYIFDASTYPIVLFDPSGEMETSAVVGGMRRIQGWTLSSIIAEATLFNSEGPVKRRIVEFIEMLDLRAADYLPHVMGKRRRELSLSILNHVQRERDARRLFIIQRWVILNRLRERQKLRQRQYSEMLLKRSQQQSRERELARRMLKVQQEQRQQQRAGVVGGAVAGFLSSQQSSGSTDALASSGRAQAGVGGGGGAMTAVGSSGRQTPPTAVTESAATTTTTTVVIDGSATPTAALATSSTIAMPSTPTGGAYSFGGTSFPFPSAPSASPDGVTAGQGAGPYSSSLPSTPTAYRGGGGGGGGGGGMGTSSNTAAGEGLQQQQQQQHGISSENMLLVSASSVVTEVGSGGAEVSSSKEANALNPKGAAVENGVVVVPTAQPVVSGPEYEWGLVTDDELEALGACFGIEELGMDEDEDEKSRDAGSLRGGGGGGGSSSGGGGGGNGNRGGVAGGWGYDRYDYTLYDLEGDGSFVVPASAKEKKTKDAIAEYEYDFISRLGPKEFVALLVSSASGAAPNLAAGVAGGLSDAPPPRISISLPISSVSLGGAFASSSSQQQQQQQYTGCSNTNEWSAGFGAWSQRGGATNNAASFQEDEYGFSLLLDDDTAAGGGDEGDEEGDAEERLLFATLLKIAGTGRVLSARSLAEEVQQQEETSSASSGGKRNSAASAGSSTTTRAPSPPPSSFSAAAAFLSQSTSLQVLTTLPKTVVCPLWWAGLIDAFDEETLLMAQVTVERVSVASLKGRDDAPLTELMRFDRNPPALGPKSKYSKVSIAEEEDA